MSCSSRPPMYLAMPTSPNPLAAHTENQRGEHMVLRIGGQVLRHKQRLDSQERHRFESWFLPNLSQCVAIVLTNQKRPKRAPRCFLKNSKCLYFPANRSSEGLWESGNVRFDRGFK